MREMKDSGIEWIGEIPAEWEIIRFKFLHNGMNTGESIDKEYWSDDEKDTVFYTAGLLPIYTSYQDFPEWKYTNGNDLLLARNGTPYVYYPVINACYTDHIIRAEMKADINRKFVKYGLQQSISSVIVNQVSIATWSASLWNEQTIPWPPLSEQQKISAHLDSECAKIDDVIAKTRATIEEYKKLKQSVITKAVTKGIRPNREMKDSGIEWIGEIPKEWGFVKITRILDYNTIYPIGDGDHGLVKPTDYQNSGIPYIRVQNLGWGTELLLENIVYISEQTNEKIKNSTLHANDVLIAKTGATIGKTGIIPSSMPIANTTSHIGKITVDSKYNARFVFYVLSSYVGYRQFWEFALLKTTRPELAIDEIKTIRITLPHTIDEQQEIADYLDQKCSEIDTLIAKKEQIVTELESYKKSLIYEYVTGKREVFDMTEKEETITIFDPQAARRMQMALAYKVIKQSGNDLKGRIHLMKIIYMLDCMLGLGLGINYLRYTRGPYNPIIESIEKNLSDKGIISVNTAKNYSYTVIDDSFDSKYNELFVKHNSEIEKIIDYMKRMKSSRAEKIATLYAAWNDMVIDEVQNITDKMIIDDVMNNWTENKAKTDFSTWQHILNDMKDKKIIPHGYGKHTRPRSE